MVALGAMAEVEPEAAGHLVLIGTIASQTVAVDNGFDRSAGSGFLGDWPRRGCPAGTAPRYNVDPRRPVRLGGKPTNRMVPVRRRIDPEIRDARLQLLGLRRQFLRRCRHFFR